MDDILKAREERFKLCRELEKYAEVEGTEVGEVCQLLIQLAGDEDYVSEKFHKALVKEIKDQLKNFKRYYKIVEQTETITVTRRELEEI